MPTLHPDERNQLQQHMHLSCTPWPTARRQCDRVCQLRMPWMRFRRLEYLLDHFDNRRKGACKHLELVMKVKIPLQRICMRLGLVLCFEIEWALPRWALVDTVQNTRQYELLGWKVMEWLILVVVDHCIAAEKHVTQPDVPTLAAFGGALWASVEICSDFSSQSASSLFTSQALHPMKRIGVRRLGQVTALTGKAENCGW